MVKPTTIRLVISLVVSNNWPLHQLDIQNAFLHRFLQEDVLYTTTVRIYSSKLSSSYLQIKKKKKSLYGLQQGPRAWFSRLTDQLQTLDFKSSKADASLYTFQQGKVQLIIFIYVDDIIVTGSDTKAIDQLIGILSTIFPVKDLGQLSFSLVLKHCVLVIVYS